MTASTSSLSPDQRILIWIILLNCFATPFMLSASNVALPVIARELDLSAVVLSWVPMIFLMTSAVFIVIFARVADLFGRKRVFLWGALGIILSSLLAASALNAPMLLLGRSLQGISAAMVYATQISLISSVVTGRERGRVIGLAVAMVYAGLAVGALVGGLILDLLNWRFTFLVHVPLNLLVLLTGLLKVEGEWLDENAGGFDRGGAVVYGLAITLLCAGVSLLPDWYSFALLLLSFTSIAWFVQRSRRRPDAIFDVSLFFENKVFSLCCLASFIIYTATFANVVLLSLLLQSVQGVSASLTGLLLMIQPVVMAVFSPLTGRLAESISPHYLSRSGMLLATIGLFILAGISATTPLSVIMASVLLLGLGFSLFSSPNIGAIMASVRMDQTGSAAASVGTTRVLGQLSSMALVALVFSLMLGPSRIEEESLPLLLNAIRLSFGIAALMCLSGLVFIVLADRFRSASTQAG